MREDGLQIEIFCEVCALNQRWENSDFTTSTWYN
jgi:hypothetical protein